MASKRLLVNADDFGLSPAINAGIIRSHVDGIVASTSIVASGSAFDEAVQLSRMHPALGVGVHLTLVEENAVAPASKIPSLAPNGILPGTYGELIKKVLTAQIRMPEIERELRAQIEKCLAAGLKPTHLDSHQHTHALPLIFPLVVRLADDYAIHGIRIPRGWPGVRDVSASRFIPKCVLCLFAHLDAVVFSLKSCVATRHFAGLFETGNLTKPSFNRILGHLRSGTTELVCHPGYADLSGPYQNWGGRRELEMATLTNPHIRDAIRTMGIEVINYRQL
jgi:predicted glycoside hydrolase/deacetylase ChbG (UPF0249 family)